MAIIAVLAVLVTGAIGIAKRQARNTQRINDLKTISTVFEAYYSKNKKYPDDNAGYVCNGTWKNTWNNLITKFKNDGYLSQDIKDPQTDFYYFACTNSTNNQSYFIAAIMEGGEKDNSSYCFPWNDWNNNKNKMEFMGNREYPCP